MTHTAMAVGLPVGVSEASLGDGRADNDVVLGRCACGCGEHVVDGYVYCRDSHGNVFVDESHAMRHYEIEVIGL